MPVAVDKTASTEAVKTASLEAPTGPTTATSMGRNYTNSVAASTGGKATKFGNILSKIGGKKLHVSVCVACQRKYI